MEGNKWDPERLDCVNPLPTECGGTGSTTFQVITNMASIDFGNILAGGSEDASISLPGVVVNDSVIVGPPFNQDPRLIVQAIVNDPDIVFLRAHNVGALAVNQSALNYRVTVVRA